MASTTDFGSVSSGSSPDISTYYYICDYENNIELDKEEQKYNNNCCHCYYTSGIDSIRDYDWDDIGDCSICLF